ncbi:NmrA family NAD(P)-binding protein [Pantoea agglomerans]
MTLNHPHNRPILVFGSTGQQGGSVASALLSRGLPVRAFVRDLTSPASLSLAAAGAQRVKGDFNDGESIREAMRDVYGVRMENGKYPTLGLFFKQL